MSERQTKILKFLRSEGSLAAWQLSMPYRLNAPMASIRRDIRGLRQNGVRIETISRPFGFDGHELAYKLVAR